MFHIHYSSFMHSSLLQPLLIDLLWVCLLIWLQPTLPHPSGLSAVLGLVLPATSVKVTLPTHHVAGVTTNI